MEFEAVVNKVLEPVSGTSAKGVWTKQDVIFELPGEFNRKVCVTFWGDKVDEIRKLNLGVTAKVSVNIESREYNGRWFTEVRAWRISVDAPAPAVSGGSSLPPLDVVADDFGGDMPF